MTNLILLLAILFAAGWVISLFTGDDKHKHSKDQRDVSQRKEKHTLDITINLPGDTVSSQVKVPFPDADSVDRTYEIATAITVRQRPTYEIEKKEVVKDV
jgi:hypothetical protein